MTQDPVEIALVEKTAPKYVLNANLFTDFIMPTISRVREPPHPVLVTSLAVRTTSKPITLLITRNGLRTLI